VGRRPIRPESGVLDFVGLEACAQHSVYVNRYLGEFYETYICDPETWREAAEDLRANLAAMGQDVHVISLQRPPNRATRRAARAV
jgi:hypothetical protein